MSYIFSIRPYPLLEITKFVLLYYGIGNGIGISFLFFIFPTTRASVQCNQRLASCSISMNDVPVWRERGGIPTLLYVSPSLVENNNQIDISLHVRSLFYLHSRYLFFETFVSTSDTDTMHSFSTLCPWVLFALQVTPYYSSVVNPTYSIRGALHARDKAGSSGSIQHAISSTYSGLSSASLSTNTSTSPVQSKSTLNSTQSSSGSFSSRTEPSRISTSAVGSKSSTMPTWKSSASVGPSYRLTSALPNSTLSQSAQRYTGSPVSAHSRRGRRHQLS